MPIWLHLTLSLAAQAGGAFVLPSLVIMAAAAKRIQGAGVFLPLFFGAFVLGFLVPRLVFSYLIPARCPKCGGKAVFHGGWPISYRCKSCGGVLRTRFNEGESW